MMLPLHRTAIMFVAVVTVLAAAWLVLFAVPDLVDRHRDSALAAALAVLVALPAGLAWGAVRLRELFAPGDDRDDR